MKTLREYVLEAREKGIAIGHFNISNLEGFHAIIGAARELNWTRDPFDRLIVAEAMLAEAGLVTKDRLIRKHFAAAIW